MIQYGIADNGNIMPCPYREGCRTYLKGCSGESYWCNNGEAMQKPKTIVLVKFADLRGGVHYDEIEFEGFVSIKKWRRTHKQFYFLGLEYPYETQEARS